MSPGLKYELDRHCHTLNLCAGTQTPYGAVTNLLKEKDKKKGRRETLLTQKTPCNPSTSASIMWCYIFSWAPCANHPHPHLLKPAPRWPSHLPAGWSVQMMYRHCSTVEGAAGTRQCVESLYYLDIFPRMLTNTLLEFCGLNPDQLY